MRRSARHAGDDDPATPDEVFPDDVFPDEGLPDAVFLVEDRGSFTHGVCRSCTWVSPGRRSRAVAASDAELHALDGCENAQTSGTSSSEDVASGRERLTARGRS